MKIEMEDYLREYALCYLATPYSKYKKGIHFAFADAARIAAHLLSSGVKVYSPIAHTHPIAIYGNIDPMDHTIWLPFDEIMMHLAESLLVAKIQGWDESRGIQHEIEFFTSRGKPVHYLEVQL